MTDNIFGRIRSVGTAIAVLGVAASVAVAQPASKVASTQPAAAQPAATPQTHDFSKYVKPNDATLKKTLSPLQYEVTQHEDTERPFNNIYWDNHDVGIYVDVVSGEPLFSSKDKYDSKTGWPSFTRPLEPKNVKTGTDTKLGYERSEVRSVHANSHLGHVFDDGPKPTGLRYCMNSASMRFIPVDRLVLEGYGEYLKLFK